MYDALTIARYIIDKSFKDGMPVSNLRLQKLLYFVQGWSYVVKREPLIKENFYAWQYGPVIPEVYFEYNGYVGTPIRMTYNDIIISDLDKEIINYILRLLKQYNDWVLVSLSHEEGGPWDKHKHNRSIIPKNEIKGYFLGLQTNNA